jgi:hypothetical protein
MATYTLISSNVLASSAASVTFSAIPATYTDLVLRINARSDGASKDDYIRYTLNADTATNYSATELYASGASVASYRDTSVSPSGENRVLHANGSTSTANTFSNGEIYIPSYTVSQNKPLGMMGVQEDNTTGGNTINALAALWRNTAAITSIKLECYSGASSFVSGSSFYLYGISSS